MVTKRYAVLRVVFLSMIPVLCFGRASSPAYLNKSLVADEVSGGFAATNHGAGLVETSCGWVGVFVATESDYIEAASTSVLDVTNSATWMVWMLRSSEQPGAYTRYMTKGDCRDAARAGSYCLFGYDGDPDTMYAKIVATDSSVYTAYIAKSMPVGEWFLLAGVYDKLAGYVYLYFNGLLIATSPSTGNKAMMPNDYSVFFGCNGDLNSFFDGRIREAWVFDQALTADDITNLYQDVAITNMPCAHWTMRPVYQ